MGAVTGSGSFSLLSAKLFIISGPSGAGKGTLLARVLEQLPRAWFSVSATTRAPRAGEVEGESYFFVTRATFEDWIARGELLEWAQVYDHYYGTPVRPVAEALHSGRSVLLDIDTQGAAQVVQRWSDSPALAAEAAPPVSVFVQPPSLDELARRLRERGTESEQQLSLRLAAAEREMACKMRYTYTLVNDDVERAAGELLRIIRREEARAAD